MKAYIGLTANKSWLSKIIRWGTEGDVSHSLILIEHSDGSRWVYEAGWKGFEKIAWEKYKQSQVKKLYDLNIDVLEPDVAVLESWVKIPYGYPELIGQAFVQLFRRVKVRIHNPFDNALGMICSEACMRFMAVLRYPGSDGEGASDYSPENLDDFLSTHPPAKVV